MHRAALHPWTKRAFSGRQTGDLWAVGGGGPWAAPLPTRLTVPPHPAAAFLKGLSDKQREEHYFCRDFVRLKKIPTWKETAKGRP